MANPLKGGDAKLGAYGGLTATAVRLPKLSTLWAIGAVGVG